MMTSKHTTQPQRTGAATRGRAFTLVELLVVLAIIVLVLGAVLPSAIRLFSAASYAQAYSVLSGQCTAARALAIEHGTYAAVHVEMAAAAADAVDAPPLTVTGQKLACFAAVMIRDDPETDEEEETFRLARGFLPRRVPGTMAFGQVYSVRAVDGGGEFVNEDGTYRDFNLPDEGKDFTTLTIAFSPAGEVVKEIDGGMLEFDGDDPIFKGESRVWADPSSEPGITAVTVFDMADLAVQSSWAEYLNTYGRFILINAYTGQFSSLGRSEQ